MTVVTEIFILKMKDSDRLNAIREKARQAFTALDGVTSWETLATLDASKGMLYAEIYSFPDFKTAQRVTAMFSELPETQKFLAQIDEILVGRFFTPIKSNLMETL